MMVRPRCAACGQSVGDYYYRQPGNDRAFWAICFCMARFETCPYCNLCGVPVGAEGRSLANGWTICGRCHQTAVHDPARAGELYERVLAITQNVLRLTLHRRPGFILVSRARLDELAAQAGVRNGGPDDRPLGLYLKRGQRRAIYVEVGLPPWLLIRVTAHEVGHAWLAENCPLLTDTNLVEGFCEWMSHHVLLALGATRLIQQMLTTPGFYGDSLRTMLELEQRAGPAAVIQACTHSQ
jgi:hypothetical protein